MDNSLNLEKVKEVYPLFIKTFKDFVPPDEKLDLTAKLNSMISYLNQTGKLTNDVVKDWNKVMDWFLNGGLDEVVQTSVNETVDVQIGSSVENLIDEKVNTRLEDTPTFSELNFVDISQSVSKVNNKLLMKISDGQFVVVTKKPSKNGFTYFKFTKGSGANADNNNYGINWDLLRLTSVLNVTKAMLYNQPTEFMTSHLYISGNDDFKLESLSDGEYTTPLSKLFISNNGRGKVGSWVSFNANIKKSHNGILHLGFFGSSGSVKNMNIYINNVLVRSNVDVSNPTAIIKTIPLDVSEYFGDITIKFEIPTGAINTSLHFLGFNFHNLAESSDNLTYNNGMFTVDTNNHYISQSTGANDYALCDTNGKFFGSFHGGETSNSLKILMDGVDCSTLPNNGFKIGKKFEIVQSTNIISKITTQSITKIYYDGVFEFECGFDVPNPFDIKRFFICMTCSNDSFSNVIYPVKITTIGDTPLPNVLKVVQENPLTNQQITTLFTPANQYKTSIPVYISNVAGTYCKVYHNKVYEVIDSLKDINFGSAKIFD